MVIVATDVHTSPPCIMVIFGAAGDLTKRKLIPALYNLKHANLLSDNFAVIGVARAEMQTEEFRQRLTDEMTDFANETVEADAWKWLEDRLYYLSGDFKDAQTFTELKTLLEKIDEERHGHGNYFFYLATAPDYFAPIVEQLGASQLTGEADDRWRRVIIEKPFGRDLDSAMKLNAELKQVLNENQIYRIDHYLGKETVQNIMVFRFGNGIFEPLWNRRYIDSVQITAAEKVGVEQRGGYYEGAGALRDMAPNHLLQLVTLTAMEPPISFDADAVRDEQTKILHAIQRPSAEEAANRAVRGQYDAGEIDGQRVAAYRSEPNVAPDSNTETFIALKLLIDNWRWADVPFYLRTGERLLHDCMMGDATLFQRADQVEAGWSVVAPIQEAWYSQPPRAFPNYKAGTWGPQEADELLKRDGREWEQTQDVSTKRQTKSQLLRSD